MLSILAFLEECGIPQEKMNHTHFQWGNRPVDHEQPVHGSLTIISTDYPDRRLSIDYSASDGAGNVEILEVEVPISPEGTISVSEGDTKEVQLRAFVEFVKGLPLIICGEA